MESGAIKNETTGASFQARPVAPFLMKMLQAGGLIPLAPEVAAM